MTGRTANERDARSAMTHDARRLQAEFPLLAAHPALAQRDFDWSGEPLTNALPFSYTTSSGLASSMCAASFLAFSLILATLLYRAVPPTARLRLP